MDFTTAVKTVLNKYATFTGRAGRPEFWYFALFSVVVTIVLAIVDSMLFGWVLDDFSPLQGLFSLAILLPSLAVSVRRMHDIGKSGWWVLISFIPLIGWLVFIYFAVQPSQPGVNGYGRGSYDT